MFQSLLLLCSRAQERLRPWCMRVCASWGCGQLSSYHLWFLLLIQYMILCPLYASTPATINLCLPWSRLITDWPVRGTLTGQNIFGIKTTSFQFRLLQIHWEQPICWGQMWRLRFIAPMTHLVVISCTGMLSVFISISDAPLGKDHSDWNIVWQGRMKTLKGDLNRDPVKYH